MQPRPTITLSPFCESDTDFFADMASDERVTRYIGNGQPWDQETIKARVRAALQQDSLSSIGATRWFLATAESKPVGIVVSSRKENGIEIGYWVAPEHWGRGIAGSMLDSALNTIPGLYGTQKLLARVDPANAASAKILTKRGFHLEAHHEGLDHYALV